MDPNKAHGHDAVSVRMLKISCPSSIKPLLIIFRNYLKFGTFPDDWKKGNAVPVHKKDKQTVDNYRHVSLLPICSNRLVFYAIFEFMIENTLRKKCPYSEFFWSVFSRFGLNTERYSVSPGIPSECGKIRTRKTPNTDTTQ